MLDAGGEVAHRDEFTGDDLERPREVEWTPAQAGPHRLELDVEVGGSRIVAWGELSVRAPRPVHVVGRGAEAIAAALRVQGIAVETTARLPDPLAPDIGVVVVTDPLDGADQRRLAEFVDAGGGLLLVGREGDGGALPQPDQPLGPLSPVERLAPLTAPEDTTGTDPQPGPDPDPDPDPPPPDPVAPPPESDPPPDPDPVPARGEIAGAGPVEGPEREVERRSVALVLVIDRSWSMSQRDASGRSRMDYAKLSAYESSRQLEEGDELGILAFGARAYTIIPLAPIPDPRELRRILEGLRAQQETTLLHETLRRAGAWLRKSKAAVRHAVVLTDGDLPDPGDRAGAQAAAKGMGDDGITVSLIQLVTDDGLGERHVRDASRIARFGRGKFVRSNNPSQIPKMIFAEVERVLGTAGRGPAASNPAPEPDPVADPPPDPEPDPVPDPPPDPDPVPPDPAPDPEPASPARIEVVAVADTVLLEPRPEDGFPSLGGIWPVAGRPEARVLLVAKTEQGTPLLAFANRGLGRVGAWSAGFLGAWSAEWREDPAFPGRLAAWVEHLRPVESAPAAQVLAERSLEPPAPLRHERAFLAALADGPLRPIDSYVAPPRGEIEVERGQAVEYALLALVALGLLAVVEWFVRRLGLGYA